MQATMALGAGVRLWHSSGQAATVTEVGQLGVYAVHDGETLPTLIHPGAWRPALTCEHCDQAAEVQLRDGQPGDVLCKGCARDQFDRPADWVRPIPRTVIRALFEQCEPLGVGGDSQITG